MDIKPLIRSQAVLMAADAGVATLLSTNMMEENISFTSTSIFPGVDWTSKRHKNLQTWCGAAQQPGTGAGISHTRQYGSASVLQRNYNPRLFTCFQQGQNVSNIILYVKETTLFLFFILKSRENSPKCSFVNEKSDWQTCSIA